MGNVNYSNENNYNPRNRQPGQFDPTSIYNLSNSMPLEVGPQQIQCEGKRVYLFAFHESH